jgi:hypothetical protein
MLTKIEENSSLLPFQTQIERKKRRKKNPSEIAKVE